MYKRFLLLILACLMTWNVFACQNDTRQGHSDSYPTSYDKWQEAFLSGNGKIGIMVFGNPLHETVIFNDRSFNFPGHTERTFAEVPSDTLDLIKKYCAEERFQEANDLAVRSSQWKNGGEGGRHPGYLLKIDLEEKGERKNYRRTCNYETGEINVCWEDERGIWNRNCFVSRRDNAAVFHLKAPTSTRLDCSICLQLSEGNNLPSNMKAEYISEKNYLNIRVRYASPLDTIGYEGGIRIRQKGGTSFVRNDTLFVSGADELILLGKNKKYYTDCTSAWKNNPLKEELKTLSTDYNKLLKAHQEIHSTIYNRVKLDLGADETDRKLSNETLLERQKQSEQPILALWERLFDAGRYHFLSSGSELTPPDLLGIWTGDSHAGWGGYYHLDANLNLQVSGGNIGAMPEVMEGYFHLNEVWRKDFETNAKKLLGCRGLLACGNSPGLSSGLMAAINDYYPYHYATGEEAWLLYPFWEHYLITEDRTFLKERLFPLLRSMGEFYEDFLKYKDKEGNYILAGSVSPESQPSNLRVSLLNNSAFDIAGARFLLSTLIKACDLLNEEPERKQIWEQLLKHLPPYLINGDGALKEWCWPGLGESYGHRHSSHLMMIWPYRELSETRTPEMYNAAHKALQMRDQHTYENAGHGYLHAALIAAGLHDKESLKQKLMTLTRRDFYYTNLATAHYPNYGTFCTDVCHAMQGILIEMLVGSDEEGIDLLPALVEGLDKGCISGVKTRCGVTVNRLSWNQSEAKVIVTLTASTTRRIRLRFGNDIQTIELKKGKPKTIDLPF